MLKDSPAIGTGTVTMKHDPRVLPIGKFLRKTKVNELPQLLNIFLGDMSVIGPRPQTPRCFEAFPRDSPDIIVQVKPGLSGIAPILFRGEEDILDGHAGTLDFYDNVIGPYKKRGGLVFRQATLKCLFFSNISDDVGCLFSQVGFNLESV